MATHITTADKVVGLMQPIVKKSIEVHVDAIADPESACRGSVDTVHKIPHGTEEPTSEEISTLRRIPGRIPPIAFTICFIELADNAAFYGVKGVFNNFMQFDLPPGSDTGAVPPGTINQSAGALGMGVQFSSAMGQAFLFLGCLLPIFGAWLADAKIGRFRAIMFGVIIGGMAHVIMIGGAAPALLRTGQGLGPFVTSLILLAISAGFSKANVAPLLIDQYRYQKQYISTTKSGERVIVDPEATIQRVFLCFYAFVNVGGLFAIATTYAEKYLGFWIAFLLPGIVYLILPIFLLIINKKLFKRPPVGSELSRFFRVCWAAFKNNKFRPWGKNYFDKAAPAYLAESGITADWSDKFVKDVARTLVACQIFLYFPIYIINDGGVGGIQTNQAATMVMGNAPNDLLGNFNPLTIIIVTPFLSHVLYPLLNRRGIKFGRINRMTFGFILAAISGIAGAVVQYHVYQSSPCGYDASTCEDADGLVLVSPISIWWQLPNVILGAISELFCYVTAYEIAYARAPDNLKGMVMAIFSVITALASLLSIILTPVINDPTMIWAWAGPAVALFLQTAIFWWRHREVNDDEYMTNEEYGAVIPERHSPVHGDKAIEVNSPGFGEEKL